MIDTSTRKRWGLTPNIASSLEDSEFLVEPDFSQPATSGAEFGSRFRASAQEWLTTWRILE